MTPTCLAGLLLVGLVAAEVPDAPLAWSPSGDRVAFVVATPPAERSLALFPFFPDDDPADAADPGGRAASAHGDEGLIYALWVVRVADGQARKVAEGPRPITSPAWGPKGHDLAFARVVPGDDGPGLARWEVVIAHPEGLEVIHRRPLPRGAPRGPSLVAEAVAWDPTGRILAVPDPEHLALELIDPQTGETTRRIEGARLAAFSPLGGPLAFYRARDERWELVQAHPDWGPEADRPIDLLTGVSQPPAWTSDGQTLLYMKPGVPTAEGIQARFFKARADGGPPEEVKEVESPTLPGERILGAYLTVADDGLDQFFLVQYSGRQVAIAYHQGSHPLDRFHPFSGLGMLGAPSLSPDGDRLAVRFGGPGFRSLPALIQVQSKRLTPLVPDDLARAAWVEALAAAAEPAAVPRQRPTRLPLAAEFGELGPSPATYKRLAELGAGLARELERSGASPTLTARPAFFFAYLRGDYAAADRVMPELSRSASNADQALRLLGLQAQLSLARGEAGEAREILDFVLQQRRDRVARVEEDGSGGFRVSQDPSLSSSWPEEIWKMHQQQFDPKAGDRPAPPALPARTPRSPFEGSPAPELSLPDTPRTTPPGRPRPR